MNTFEETLKKSHTSCCSATLAIDKRSWENTILIRQWRKRCKRDSCRIDIILADICQAECIVDEQMRPLCLMRIFFWGVNVMYN